MVKIIDPSIEVLSELDGEKMLKHIELCARNCYKSENNITEDVSSAVKMVKRLIELGHTAMLEHASITVRLTCDIGVYKDLTRHRMASYAIESTRYCNYSKGKFGNELTVIRPIHIDEETEAYAIWFRCMEEIEKRYLEMAGAGCLPDQLRMVLPHSTAASVVMTTNIREWRHIFELRCAKPAHPSVRQITLMLLKKFHAELPVLFDDLFALYEEDIATFVQNRKELY